MDTLSSGERSARMSRIRGKDSNPELAVRSLVHRLGYRFRKHRQDLPGHPDIVFPGRRKIIFVHGCFWHRHKCHLGRLPKSRLNFWVPKLKATEQRDHRNLTRLRETGWQVLTIWECEIADSGGRVRQDGLEAIARRIESFLDA